MIVSTKNEYDELRSVLVGSVDNFAWPVDDKEFNASVAKSTYEKKMDQGPVADTVLKEANEDLQQLTEILESNGVKVVRPKISKPSWAYSARDIILIVGNKVIECPTPFNSRAKELDLYPELKSASCDIIRAPRPNTNEDPMFDAANVLKLDDKLLYLVSKTANREGAEWLQHAVGSEFEVVTWEGVYSHAHIDSTVSSLCKDTVLLNGSRVTEDNLPSFMQDYKKIWVNDIEEKDFYEFPFASKWIGMNILSIDPETVIVDPLYKDLILTLQEENFKVIQTPLTHARTLGGGFHCVTCDLERE